MGSVLIGFSYFAATSSPSRPNIQPSNRDDHIRPRSEAFANNDNKEAKLQKVNRILKSMIIIGKWGRIASNFFFALSSSIPLNCRGGGVDYSTWAYRNRLRQVPWQILRGNPTVGVRE